MKIREAIDRADALNPNQYTEEEKLRWLSVQDATVIEDILLTHERNIGEQEPFFRPYTPEDMDKELIVPFPYDELYISYLDMKISEANKETDRYNNAVTLFNSYMTDFACHYNRTHMPKFTHNHRLWG